jgi:pimeloyl-ACP methyl ester carboxylesterase
MTTFTADDGETIPLAIDGQGPPLVMLHGWTASRDTWSPVIEGLAQHHTVYRWDARGHGWHRPTTDTPPTVQRMARDLADLLAQFALEKPAVVGHSMGALTIWEYVRAFGTARLGRLCLVDQSPKLVTDASWKGGLYGDFDAARSERLLAELESDFAEAVLRLAASGLNERARRNYEENAPGWRLARQALREMDRGPLIATWKSLVAADYRDVLPAIDIPTLLVYGAESNFYPPEAARYVGDRIPGAVLHVYEGADHSPHWSDSGRFEREVLAWAALAT